ncbi:DUF3450 domain-containing protein [Ketobacter sp. MCCC 1A13808]|uniref:DUF3450 domain-containing protein n=1 Tax=Ketobacter sp. MCCC 1A13808 TaxID=2602738 RepID=UPI0012EB5168|nr:DUF3450 domain-containing protein [Ketobacter sp. MCCC 1A13808]MVF12148.1 DUF3450 domain-containing protein [Ketobacter sp. MCCC 1A13808]
MRKITPPFLVRHSAILLSASFLFSTTSIAASVDQVVGENNKANVAAKQSQSKIDSISQQTDKLFNEYKVVSKEFDGLRVYNSQLEKQIANQLKEMESINSSIDQVTVIERQIVPLMLRMIDGLKQFVELDVPFLQEERDERISNLDQLMERADVSVAEKFRKVIEAYQIESEYGRTIEAYRGTIDIAGNQREVDFLRIGRVSLMYQTDDSKYSGIWDNESKDWAPLTDQYRSAIRDGLRIARKEVAPNLLKLPVQAAETVQ